MASGHEDFMDWEGRNTSAEGMTSYSFDINLNSMQAVSVDLNTTASGYKTIYQCISISCNDDSAINFVILKRKSDGWIFFSAYFIGGGIFDFPGQALGSGAVLTMDVYNYSGSTLNFKGAVNWADRTQT